MLSNEGPVETETGVIHICVGDGFEVKLDAKMMQGYIKVNGQEIHDVTKLNFSYDWNEGGSLYATVEFIITS